MSATRTPRWTETAFEAVVDLANDLGTFTTDDVWDYLAANNITPQGDHRALGGVIQRAYRDGLISGTFAFRRSTRTQNHGRPIRVWKAVA